MSPVGAKSQLMWGYEEVAGVAYPGQKAPTMYGLRVANFEFGPVPVWDQRSNLDAKGMQLKDDLVGYDVPFKFNSNMSVDDLKRWRAHQQGFASIANPAAGVYDWTIRELLSTDVLTVDPSRISIEGDVDDGYAGLGTNGAVDQMECKVASRKIIDWTFNGKMARFTNLRDPEAVVGPATFVGVVLVRGLRHDADAEDTTNDIKFKITTAGGSGAAKLKFTKGATAYGSVEYTITYGATYSENNWIDVIYGDGTHASGDQLNPVQIQFIGAGNFVAGGTPDEWKIRAKRVKGVATYPSRNPFKAGKCILTAGGTTREVEEFSIIFRTPKAYRLSTSSLWPVGLVDDDARSISIRAKRKYIDRYFNLKRLSGTPIAFDAELNGDLIATVANVSYYERSKFTSANAQVKNGGVRGVDNSKSLDEEMEFEPFWDGTNADMNETHRGTLSALK